MDYPWKDLRLGALQQNSHQEFQIGPAVIETIATSINTSVCCRYRKSTGYIPIITSPVTHMWVSLYYIATSTTLNTSVCCRYRKSTGYILILLANYFTVTHMSVAMLIP